MERAGIMKFASSKVWITIIVFVVVAPCVLFAADENNQDEALPESDAELQQALDAARNQYESLFEDYKRAEHHFEQLLQKRRQEPDSVTSEEFEPYFDDLADWKTTKGVPAVTRTVSWIRSNYPGGCDTPERIRMFIEDAYTSWGTTYVLLGGDTDVIPVRFAKTTYYDGEELPSDLYYSDLDGDWNDDGDDIFGEAFKGETDPGDSVDLYPDVFVGRAPVGSIVELETFIEKGQAYENSPVPFFTERNLYLAEVLFPYDWECGDPYDDISLDGRDLTEDMDLLIEPTWSRTKLYQSACDSTGPVTWPETSTRTYRFPRFRP